MQDLGAHHEGFEDEDYTGFVGWIGRRKCFGPPRTILVGYSFVRGLDRAFCGAAAFDDKGEGLGNIFALFVKQTEDGTKKEGGKVDKGGHFGSFFVLFVSLTGMKENEYKRVGMGHLVQLLDFDFAEKVQMTII
ncbi:MAG: hypothetical protein MMC23_005102 [Stictis urceolatum]|nr:hypothetical protein [Stictis urceolata]